MKGNEQVIGVLNQVLRKELTGINQYFIHAKMCKNWGYERLYKLLWEESIGEMKHADEIIERIIFLEGVPNISAYDKILVGTSVKQQLENDLGLESAALTVLHPGSRLASKPATIPQENYWSTSSWTRKNMLIGSNPNFIK